MRRWVAAGVCAGILGALFASAYVTEHRRPPLVIPPSLELPTTLDQIQLPPENFVPGKDYKG